MSKGIEVFSKRATQIGDVTVTFTVGRIVKDEPEEEQKPEPTPYEGEDGS